MKWWPMELLPGDMIRVKIGSVYHYGIYCGEGEIIQFGEPPVTLIGRRDEDIAVCIASAEEFSCGNIIEKAILDKKEMRRRIPAEKTVSIAKSRIGEKGYSLLHNNCEHFAYECVFGVRQSTQEQDARDKWNNRQILDVYIAEIPKDIEIKPIASPMWNKDIQNTKAEDLKTAKYYEWQILCYAVRRAFGFKAEDIDFRKTITGKWKCDKFFLSVSHTASAVIVGISNKKIYVAAESVKNKNRLPSKDEKTDIISLENIPDCLFSVSGENIKNAHYYRFENESAKAINNDIIKSEFTV